MGVYDQTGLSGLHADGLLGLSPRSLSTTGGQLLLRQLTQAGQIINNIILFSIGGGTEADIVQIGEVHSQDFTLAAKADVLNHHYISSQNYWEVDFSDPMIGTTPISTKAVTAIVDTGSSYIVVPKSDFIEIGSYW